ncbi:hypothetical protein Tco_0228960 [Tanacetum coccineum]
MINNSQKPILFSHGGGRHLSICRNILVALGWTVPTNGDLLLQEGRKAATALRLTTVATKHIPITRCIPSVVGGCKGERAGLALKDAKDQLGKRVEELTWSLQLDK